MPNEKGFKADLNIFKEVSPRITDNQRKGLLQRAVQRYGLAVEQAADILEKSGLVVGEEVNYFAVLGFSIEELQHQTDADIAAQVDTVHKELYNKSLIAGGSPRPDGRTQEQWRDLLNQARDTLKNPQRRREHIETLRTKESVISPDADGPKNMVLIPAGEFQMGSNDKAALDDEKPVHTVYVDAFYMDQYPVTNAEYKKFLDANPQWHLANIRDQYDDVFYLTGWKGNTYPTGKGQHPVVWVSWYAAMAYAEWMEKRLPTEAEWEKAARGGLVGKKYPWGDTIKGADANYNNNEKDTTAIGGYDPNNYGLYDMAGNVSEWCLDAYDNNFYPSSPTRNPLSGMELKKCENIKRVRRGGSWFSTAPHVRVASRKQDLSKKTDKGIGFRCVQPI